MFECFLIKHENTKNILKVDFHCTDGRVKLWVYAVTAVGFILILFIIAFSFLVWYVPIYLLESFITTHNFFPRTSRCVRGPHTNP